MATVLLVCGACLDFPVCMRDLDTVACWQVWYKPVRGQGSPFEAELDNTEHCLSLCVNNNGHCLAFAVNSLQNGWRDESFMF